MRGGTRPLRGVIETLADIDAGMEPRGMVSLSTAHGPLFVGLAERTPFELSHALLARMGRDGSIFNMLGSAASTIYAGEVCAKVRDLSEYNPPAWEPWFFLKTRRPSVRDYVDAAHQLAVLRALRLMPPEALAQAIPAIIALTDLRDVLAVPSRLDAVVRLLAGAYGVAALTDLHVGA